MKIFNSTVVSLDTQFWAVSNYVYHYWFHFLCKWNTVECITFIYFCHRCCNNDSRPDTAPGGGGKWASPNLQVWKKLVASIWKLTHRGRNKWPTLSRLHFQMKFPHENVSILILISLRVKVHLNKSALVQVKKYRLLPNEYHAITWTKVNKNLSCHMTSLGHDEFKTDSNFTESRGVHLNESALVPGIGCCLINTMLLEFVQW